MIEIHNLDLRNKTILEVGTGRGGTTLELIELLKKFPSAKLITSDIIDVKEELMQFCQGFMNVQNRITFIQSDATDLNSIPNESIDIIIVNYTLCAINSIIGKLTMAINRFFHLLKPGGILLIEEEYPIESAKTENQCIWADKWRMLKTALISSGNLPFNEIHPDQLTQILSLLNFIEIEKEDGLNMLHHSEILPLFEYQISGSISSNGDSYLEKGLLKWAGKIKKKIEKLEFMEIPYYRLSAKKT
ncbi:hypothetical protein NEF87_004758 [Candidatus Lokiarchaeum ossiferum]|uniref:Methyltransferase domain-containing protein n=1 Tax=Candidatus Lokiarchaeum ossiferum TaxID=2951803 RepID=A0ABY6HY58_9ARCH|nr:hypothetical protein NEF87_004758 [Candidatus Lokiarchaeum sp. B-35]